MASPGRSILLTDSSQNGFSLLEVLLAVLILGLSLTVIFSSANKGVAVVSQARNYQISRGLLHELTLRDPLDLEEIEEGEFQGAFSHPEHGRVEWIRTVTLEGAEADRFYHLLTEISWGERSHPQRESIETYLHQPTAIRGGWVQEPLDEF
jgi:prepilin-type N-terminal cleavage/methylation domain-containing protein